MTAQTKAHTSALHVLVVGAGLGGLACAIACRRAEPLIKVTLIERTPEILPVGAGIQIPPNASRIMDFFGLSQKLVDRGGVLMKAHTLRRYADGKVLVEKPWTKMREQYGGDWLVIHRADYQLLLLEEAKKLGVNLLMGAEMEKVDLDAEEPAILLKDGTRLVGDVIVGADGLWSTLRSSVLDKPIEPGETGDLAYRGTFSLEQMTDFKDERIDELIRASNVQVWMGPQKHVVFYPVKNHTEYNLVLLCPDTVPQGKRVAEGSVEEMAELFDGWDPILRKLISCLTSALKWKLHHVAQLETWSMGPIVLIGDACHPTLPYQAQGAAMAVEDGAVLGALLGRLQEHLTESTLDKRVKIADILKLFEQRRKQRTEINVSGAVEKQDFYHLPDGERQIERDQLLADLPKADFKVHCKWSWGDKSYNDELLGVDVIRDAESSFTDWVKKQKL